MKSHPAREIKQALLEGLIVIRDDLDGALSADSNFKLVESMGLCGNLRKFIHEKLHSPGTCYGESAMDWVGALIILRSSWKQWPKFSGVLNYPIDVVNSTLDPQTQYDAAELNDGFWDQDTEYGRERVELLNWLIEDLSPDE